MSKRWIERKITKEHGILRVPQKWITALKLRTKSTNIPEINCHLWALSSNHRPKTCTIINQRPPFCALAKSQVYRVELWVYNTNTAEDWTNKVDPLKVDVLGKFTELWIATMLWRHGVIKFDNCAGLFDWNTLQELKVEKRLKFIIIRHYMYDLRNWVRVSTST